MLYVVHLLLLSYIACSCGVQHLRLPSTSTDSKDDLFLQGHVTQLASLPFPTTATLHSVILFNNATNSRMRSAVVNLQMECSTDKNGSVICEPDTKSRNSSPLAVHVVQPPPKKKGGSPLFAILYIRCKVHFGGVFQLAVVYANSSDTMQIRLVMSDTARIWSTSILGNQSKAENFTMNEGDVSLLKFHLYSGCPEVFFPDIVNQSVAGVALAVEVRNEEGDAAQPWQPIPYTILSAHIDTNDTHRGHYDAPCSPTRVDIQVAYLALRRDTSLRVRVQSKAKFLQEFPLSVLPQMTPENATLRLNFLQPVFPQNYTSVECLKKGRMGTLFLDPPLAGERGWDTAWRRDLTVTRALQLVSPHPAKVSDSGLYVCNFKYLKPSKVDFINSSHIAIPTQQPHPHVIIGATVAIRVGRPPGEIHIHILPSDYILPRETLLNPVQSAPTRENISVECGLSPGYPRDNSSFVLMFQSRNVPIWMHSVSASSDLHILDNSTQYFKARATVILPSDVHGYLRVSCRWSNEATLPEVQEASLTLKVYQVMDDNSVVDVHPKFHNGLAEPGQNYTCHLKRGDVKDIIILWHRMELRSPFVDSHGERVHWNRAQSGLTVPIKGNTLQIPQDPQYAASRHDYLCLVTLPEVDDFKGAMYAVRHQFSVKLCPHHPAIDLHVALNRHLWQRCKWVDGPRVLWDFYQLLYSPMMTDVLMALPISSRATRIALYGYSKWTANTSLHLPLGSLFGKQAIQEVMQKFSNLRHEVEVENEADQMCYLDSLSELRGNLTDNSRTALVTFCSGPQNCSASVNRLRSQGLLLSAQLFLTQPQDPAISQMQAQEVYHMLPHLQTTDESPVSFCTLQYSWHRMRIDIGQLREHVCSLPGGFRPPIDPTLKWNSTLPPRMWFSGLHLNVTCHGMLGDPPGEMVLCLMEHGKCLPTPAPVSTSAVNETLHFLLTLTEQLNGKQLKCFIKYPRLEVELYGEFEDSCHIQLMRIDPLVVNVHFMSKAYIPPDRVTVANTHEMLVEGQPAILKCTFNPTFPPPKVTFFLEEVDGVRKNFTILHEMELNEEFVRSTDYFRTEVLIAVHHTTDSMERATMEGRHVICEVRTPYSVKRASRIIDIHFTKMHNFSLLTESHVPSGFWWQLDDDYIQSQEDVEQSDISSVMYTMSADPEKKVMLINNTDWLYCRCEAVVNVNMKSRQVVNLRFVHWGQDTNQSLQVVTNIEGSFVFCQFLNPSSSMSRSLKLTHHCRSRSTLHYNGIAGNVKEIAVVTEVALWQLDDQLKSVQFHCEWTSFMNNQTLESPPSMIYRPAKVVELEYDAPSRRLSCHAMGYPSPNLRFRLVSHPEFQLNHSPVNTNVSEASVSIEFTMPRNLFGPAILHCEASQSPDSWSTLEEVVVFTPPLQQATMRIGNAVDNVPEGGTLHLILSVDSVVLHSVHTVVLYKLVDMGNAFSVDPSPIRVPILLLSGRSPEHMFLKGLNQWCAFRRCSHSVNISVAEYRFVISKVALHDAGRYEFRVFYFGGGHEAVMHPVRLLVTTPPKTPQMKLLNHNLEEEHSINAGEFFYLDCVVNLGIDTEGTSEEVDMHLSTYRGTVTSSKALKIFRSDGKTLSTSFLYDYRTWDNLDGTRSASMKLQLLATVEEYHGYSFVCLVQSSLGSTSAEVSPLRINHPVSGTHITPSTETKIIFTSHEVLQCSASRGYPPPLCTWIIDSPPNPVTHNVTTITVSDNNNNKDSISTLHLHRLLPITGVYSGLCTCVNSYHGGSQDSAPVVFFLTNNKKMTTSLTANMSHNVVSPNSSVQFHCINLRENIFHQMALTLSTVAFFKSQSPNKTSFKDIFLTQYFHSGEIFRNKSFPENAHFNPVYHEGLYKLIIQRVQSKDYGIYGCVATFRNGAQWTFLAPEPLCVYSPPEPGQVEMYTMNGTDRVAVTSQDCVPAGQDLWMSCSSKVAQSICTEEQMSNLDTILTTRIQFYDKDFSERKVCLHETQTVSQDNLLQHRSLFKVDASHNKASVFCEASLKSMKQTDLQPAIKTGVERHLCVLYPPEDLQIEPSIDVIYPNQSVTCAARGNPKPFTKMILTSHGTDNAEEPMWHKTVLSANSTVSATLPETIHGFSLTVVCYATNIVLNTKETTELKKTFVIGGAVKRPVLYTRTVITAVVCSLGLAILVFTGVWLVKTLLATVRTMRPATV